MSNNVVWHAGWSVNWVHLLHHFASPVPDRTQYTMFSPVGWKKSSCWVRQGVETGAAPRVPFHCSWLKILLPTRAQECSRLGFPRDIMFYCIPSDTISVSPCLAAMQQWQQVFTFAPEGEADRRKLKKRRDSYSNRPAGDQTAASQRGREDITASIAKTGKQKKNIYFH